MRWMKMRRPFAGAFAFGGYGSVLDKPSWSRSSPLFRPSGTFSRREKESWRYLATPKISNGARLLAPVKMVVDLLGHLVRDAGDLGEVVE